MLKKAREKTEFDYFATGHYAQTVRHENFTFMTQAEDQNKDQTFYLSNLSEGQISQALFPIGHLNKNVVKSIAVKNGLSDWALKKESQGICFVGKKRNMGRDNIHQV